MIVVIDYDLGNNASILNMLKRIGIKAKISSKLDDIEKADKLILPGIGAFDHAMMKLNKLEMIQVLNKSVVKEKVPILGICLGMQLMTKRSEEGISDGLGWIDAETVRFRFNDKSLKIPHMGWNTVHVKKRIGPFKEMYKEARFYFVHSFFVKCKDRNDIMTTTKYSKFFTSSIAKENIFGVQFHPEKSHKFGMKVLKNYAEF